MKRTIAAFIIVIAAFAAGCAAGGEEADDRIIVTDSAGRQVEVPPDPQRIGAVEPFASQMIIMYGLGDKLVATVGGVQRDLLLQEISPSLVDAAVMSGGDPNVEELLRLRKDGKILAIGISNASPDILKEYVKIGPIALVQEKLSILDAKACDHYIPL